MSNTQLPWWITDNFELTGAEDPPDGGTEGTGGEGAGTGQEGTEGNEGGEEGAPKEKDPADTTGLKSALEKERRDRARAERELKRLQTAEQERADAEKTEVQRAKDEAETAKTKAARLAAGFRDERINNAIIAAAVKNGFFDAEDAVLAVDRDSISWDQDDDDPAKVTIDKKTVETAVKKLATQKPHLIKKGTDDGQRSGSQFGGGGTGSKQQEADEAVYRRRYSAL